MREFFLTYSYVGVAWEFQAMGLPLVQSLEWILTLHCGTLFVYELKVALHSLQLLKRAFFVRVYM